MKRPIVVGIAGGSASGKSTVVRELTRLLGPGRCSTLHHDAYYHDLSHLPVEARIEVNVDHPDSLETALLVEHLRELIAGRPVEMPRYDYVAQVRATPGTTVEPAPVLIVEGLLTFVDAALRDLMDVRAFVDATEEARLARRIERDALERGRDRSAVVRQHESIVQPMHDRFVEPTREHAHVMIPEGGHNLIAIEALARRVEALLGGEG